MQNKIHILFLLLFCCSDFFSLYAFNGNYENYEDYSFLESSSDRYEDSYLPINTQLSADDFPIDNFFIITEDDSFLDAELRAKPGKPGGSYLGDGLGLEPVGGREISIFTILALLYTTLLCRKNIYQKITKK